MREKFKNTWNKIKGFIKDMFINTFSFGIYIITQQIILMPIMSRILSQEEYANYIIYISVFAIISNVLGSELGIVRQIRDDKEEGKSYNRILAILIPIILVISAISLYFLKYNIVDISFLTISIILANIRLYSASCFRMNKDFKKVLLQNVIYLIGILIGLAIYIKWNYVWIPALVAEMFTFIYNLFNTDILKAGISKKRDKDIIKTFSNLGFISLLVNGVVYFDKILIYPILGGTAVTLYYATSAMSKVINLIVNPLYSVILSWLKDNDEKFKSKIVSLTIKINIPVLIFSFVISVPLTYIALKILYPQYFAEALYLIIPVCISLAFSVVSSLVKAILLKYMDSKKLVKAYVIYFIIFVMSAIIMSKLMGLIGFAYSNIISKFSLWLIFLILLKKCNIISQKMKEE